jgi:uncharacterized membrane protein YoaK (UPF0700 family)
MGAVRLRRRALPAAIAFTSAMVDMLCWLSLARFHSATLTGDLSLTVTSLLPRARLHLLEIAAVPVFLCGLIASYLTVRRLSGDPRLVLRTLFVAQAVLLTLAAVVAGALPLDPRSATTGNGIDVGLVPMLLCVLAICLSNTTMSMLDREAPTTWALTANIARTGIALLDLATRRGDAEERMQRRAVWTRTWPTVCAFLLGGVVATVALAEFGQSAWLLPGAITIAYAIVDWQLPPSDG